MRTCVDCGNPIEFGRGWGGGGVCPKCRGRRGAKSAMEKAKLAGKGFGNKNGIDPLVGKAREW